MFRIFFPSFRISGFPGFLVTRFPGFPQPFGSARQPGLLSFPDQLVLQVFLPFLLSLLPGSFLQLYPISRASQINQFS